MEPVIRLHKVSVRYGALEVIRGLDLEVRPGEVFGLLGGNGAGKTTTLRVLVGQKTPASGRVEIFGKDLACHWRDIKPMLGYVPDGSNHFDELSGRGNLLFFAGLYGVPASRVEECLQFADLHGAADVPVARYSLGMRRKLLLARALLHRPRLLILDEPTANLDAHASQKIQALIRDHARRGGSVLLTTHRLENVEELCDSVGVLAGGTLQAVDAPSALRGRHAGNKVAVRLADGTRCICDLEQAADRAALAQQLLAGAVVNVHAQPYDFEDALSDPLV